MFLLYSINSPIGYSLDYMPIHSMRQIFELASLNTATISIRVRMIKLQWSKLCSLMNVLESFLSGLIGTGTRIVYQLRIAIVKLVLM